MDPERDDPTVGFALRTLARHDRERPTSASHVQATLRAHVRGRAAARSTRRQRIVAAAAGVAGLVLVVAHDSPRPAPSASIQTTSVALADDVTTDFFPLPHGSVPLTDGQVVRIEVPRTALSEFGLAPESPELAEAAVLADVLVGEDGLARAVRFVRAVAD